MERRTHLKTPLNFRRGNRKCGYANWFLGYTPLSLDSRLFFLYIALNNYIHISCLLPLLRYFEKNVYKILLHIDITLSYCEFSCNNVISPNLLYCDTLIILVHYQSYIISCNYLNSSVIDHLFCVEPDNGAVFPPSPSAAPTQTPAVG